MKSECTFYCYDCSKAFDNLWNGLYCPYCHSKVFENFKDLENYLKEEEQLLNKEPFNKPRGFKNRSNDG